VSYANVFKAVEDPTVEVMRQAVAKVGEGAFEDMVVAHIAKFETRPEGVEFAHEVERVARKIVKDDYAAADPSPAPDVTVRDLVESGGVKINPKPKKRKGWFQRMKEAWAPVGRVQSTAKKGYSALFDKHGK
jgi:hypothetical protein